MSKLSKAKRLYRKRRSRKACLSARIATATVLPGIELSMGVSEATCGHSGAAKLDLPFELDKQHLGDCLQKLKLLPDECIDFVFTSPPYMAGKVYEDESCKDKETYRKTLCRIFREIARVLTPNGTFALEWGYGKDTDGPGTAVPFIYYMYDDLKEMGFLIKQQIVWHYPGGRTGSSSKKHQRLFARHEYIYCLTMNPAGSHLDITESRDIRLNRTLDKKNNQFGRNPTDVWKTFPSRV